MTRVVHFEINADDPERVVKFFETVFGWKIEKWKGPTPYWLVMTGDPKQPGIDGGIQKRMRPGTAVVNTIDVADVDEIARRVERNGGRIVMPKTEIPGVGFVIYFEDTEGNLHGAIQSLPMQQMQRPG